MAATAASFSAAVFEASDPEISSASPDPFGGNDLDVEWVLPSAVDALGRSVEGAPLLVAIRRKLSPGAIRSYLARLRQPRF